MGEKYYLLTSRELHVHAAWMPIVQMLPDSELADAALQSTELWCIDVAMVTVVKCQQPGQLRSFDGLLSVCQFTLRDGNRAPECREKHTALS